MIDGMSPIPPQKSVDFDPAKTQKEDAKLKKAVQDFEEVFLKQLFSEMRKSIPKSGLFGGGQEKQMFESMLDDERAKAWEQSGGIGLADMMYQQLKRTQGDKPSS